MSIVSTLIVLAILGLVIVNAPGWEQFRYAFFNAEVAAETLPSIVQAFGRNVIIFLAAEVLVLILGLILAIMRSLPGPVFTPIRGIAIVYVDIFRGLPGILVIWLFGFGLPSLGLDWMPDNEFFWGLLVLSLIHI